MMKRMNKALRRSGAWLLLCLFFAAGTSIVSAQGYYDAAQCPEGAGTEANPYKVFSTEHFLWIAQQVNSGNDLRDEYFSVTQDIDFSDIHHPVITGFGKVKLVIERPLGRCWLLIRGAPR